MSGHGKQNRGKAWSVTEAMPTEMDNVPMDEEFTAFVRTTLTCLNDKMDNLITKQKQSKQTMKES